MQNSEHIGKIIRQLSQKLGISEKITENRVIEIWNEMFAKAPPDSAVIKYIENRKAFIETKSSTWRVEITLRKDKLLNEVNEKLGQDFLKDLIIK